jgi:hypothetical protein
MCFTFFRMYLDRDTYGLYHYITNNIDFYKPSL